MKKANRRSIISLSFTCLTLVGCATAQENRFALAGASALLGGTALPALAPANEDKSQQTTLGFFAGAALGLAVGNLLFSDEPAAKEVRKKNEELKNQLLFLEHAKNNRVRPQKDLKIVPIPTENQARVFDEVYENANEK